MDEWIHIFNKSVCSNVHVIARLEFEFADNDVTGQHFSINTSGKLSNKKKKRKKEEKNSYSITKSKIATLLYLSLAWSKKTTLFIKKKKTKCFDIEIKDWHATRSKTTSGPTHSKFHCAFTLSRSYVRN